MGNSHVGSAFSSRPRSGVEGHVDNVPSSSVEFPSRDGVDEWLGMVAAASCSSTERASSILGGGERGVTADLSFSSVGHSLGDGMTIEGYRFLAIAIRFFTELDSLIGTSPSDSLAETSYISSNSLSELRLLHIEVASEEGVTELVGEGASSNIGIIATFAFGVGTLSLIGDSTCDRD